MKAKKSLKNFDPVNLKIISEISAFFMSRGAKELQMGLKDEDDSVCMYVQGMVEDLSQDDVQDATVQLGVKRQHEVENYYWQLSGEEDEEDFITVGMMVDSSEVEYSDGRLEIRVTRRK